MEEKLLGLIKKIRSERRLVSFDEAATKQAVILRILSCLGWDTFNIDEVHPEYSVGGKRVDYALRHNNYNKVFIEVKKVGEDLEKYQEQLLNYSFQEGVKLAVLTNGITWWLYLPLHEGSWEQRKFYTVEIFEQGGEEITLKFTDFLSNENVISGKAIDNAENIYKGRQKQYLIKETLPKAWNYVDINQNILW
jgi:predicted type IV restriction endonuclease